MQIYDRIKQNQIGITPNSLISKCILNKKARLYTDLPRLDRILSKLILNKFLVVKNTRINSDRCFSTL